MVNKTTVNKKHSVKGRMLVEKETNPNLTGF
jgi:hypothetical protein